MSPETASLPAGWAEATVGDLGEFINGLAFKPADWGTEGRPIIRIQNLTNREAAFNLTRTEFDPRFVVKHGDILVSWSATLDAFTWRGPEAILNQHIFKVVPTTQIPEHRFVFWGLKNAIAEMWESPHTHGTTMRHINRKPFLAHRFALPPLREQGRLADALDSYFTRLDDAEATLERVKRNLERYRASVLQAAVEGRLVLTEARLARVCGRKYEQARELLRRVLRETGRPQESVFPVVESEDADSPLPEGWCWASVDQVSTEVKYGTSARATREDASGVPVLRMGNIVDGSLQLEDLKFLPKSHSEFSDLHLRPGDMLFNRTNSAEMVGKSAAFRGHPRACSFASYLIRVRLAEGVSAEYLAAFMNSLSGRRWAASVVSQQVGQANVNGTKLKACVFPLPPAAEQLRIIAELDRLRSLAATIERTLELTLLRKGRLAGSILRIAFQGHLVDQDPSDEPASVLLDRIRAERAKAASSPQTPRRRGRPRKAVKR